MEYKQARNLVRRELKWCFDNYLSYDEACAHINDWLGRHIKNGRFNDWEDEDFEDLVLFKDTILRMWFDDF